MSMKEISPEGALRGYWAQRTPTDVVVLGGAFLRQESPRTFVRQMEKDERGFTLELWRKIAELGWLGLIVPEEYGG